MVLLGGYKSDAAEILEQVTTEPLYRMAVGDAARAAVLREALRGRFRFREGLLTSWMARDVIDFAGRRIGELSRMPARFG